MSFYRKLFKLPTPVELGMSEYNALPCREFTPDVKGVCWEDWHIKVKKLHPIKYFFAETLRNLFYYKIYRFIKNPIVKLHYWIISNTIRRYHMLDLRQPCINDNPDCYEYGWRDVPEKMLYAMFNLLKEYLEEKPFDLTTQYSMEEINEDPGMKSQYEFLQEAKIIHKWWTVDRINFLNKKNELLTMWANLKRKEGSLEESEIAYKVMKELEDDIERQTDEMLARLLKIRRGLWT